MEKRSKCEYCDEIILSANHCEIWKNMRKHYDVCSCKEKIPESDSVHSCEKCDFTTKEERLQKKLKMLNKYHDAEDMMACLEYMECCCLNRSCVLHSRGD